MRPEPYRYEAMTADEAHLLALDLRLTLGAYFPVQVASAKPEGYTISMPAEVARKILERLAQK